MNLFKRSMSTAASRYFLQILFFSSIFAGNFHATTAKDLLPQEELVDPISSLIEQKQNAIILFYRSSCPLSSYSYSLFESMTSSFKKQVRWFIAINVTPKTISFYKKQYNITAVPSFLFIKEGQIVHQYTMDDQITKNIITKKVNTLYPPLI